MDVNRIGYRARTLLVGLALSCPAMAETIDIARYANVAAGHGWTYAQSDYPQPWHVVVDSLTTMDGQAAWLLQEYDWQYHPNDQTYFLASLLEGLRELAAVNDFGQASQTTFYWLPPVHRLLPEMVAGQSYSFTVQRSDFPGIEFTHTISLTRETVKVPAGTFAHALKVSESFSHGEAGVPTEVRWYARDVGLVKRVHNDGNVWELSSVSGFALPAPALMPILFWLLPPVDR